ncbi:hypothetical protein HU200_034584 [Digitaria exilis]|uniref:Uncharacterized protein n=1 Tax=Digitaria exilis TaxID=1010633 RepID=A0A835BTT3_9POAL|nr:hypothetical protein HU200_034584 [Digitaria exilis]
MAGRDEGDCKAQSLEVEDVAGDGRKRKTAEETVRGGQVFAPLIAELAKHKKKAPDEDAAAAAVKMPPPGQKARMSAKEIRSILSWKPMSAPRHYEALKESNPDLTPLPGEEMDEERESLFLGAKIFYCMQERYPKMQEWMRQEQETKGYVEMDEDWVRRRAEAQQAFEDGRKEIEKTIRELQFSEDDLTMTTMIATIMTRRITMMERRRRTRCEMTSPYNSEIFNDEYYDK